MNKAGKIVLLILSISVALLIGTWLFIGALWTGAFNFMLPSEIATYSSPDGEYSLVFEQMGDPAWPFGPTDVSLTLKDQNSKIIERASTQVFNDGVCASEWNIKSVSWNRDAVVVILQSAEAQDQEISIPYNEK